MEMDEARWHPLCIEGCRQTTPLIIMKKFRFPLRSVATVRALREQRARDVFSAAVHAYVGAEERVGEIRNRIAELEEVLRSQRVQTFRASDQVAFLQAHRRETLCETAAIKVAAQAKMEMERRRQEWLEARRDVRLLENLELKARGMHRRDLEHEEQSLLDDRTNALFARAS